MNIGKYSTILVSLLLAGILIGTVGIPVIDSIANQTNTVSNSGAQWVRMAYVEDDSDYSFTVHMNDNDTVTITNGDSVQTGPADDIILYADEYHTLFIKDGVLCMIGDSFNNYISGGPTVEGYDVTITRTNGTVTKTDRFGSNWGEPSWAYVPITGGIYSSFGANAVPLHRYSEEVVAVGTYAGVYAGQMGVVDILYDYGLVMDADVTADYINSIQWVQESELVEEPLNVLPFDPNDIDPLDPGVIVDPFDPGQIQPIDIDPIPIDPGNQIMSVPTPTYTDGDWGYDIMVQNNTNYARIVSYNGVGGGAITFPTTLGGYDVRAIGKGGSNQGIFDPAITGTDITIPDYTYLYEIASYAFYKCGFTGKLTINETTVGNEFSNYICAQSSFSEVETHLLSVIKSMGGFQKCANLSKVTIIGNGTTYPTQSTFSECTSLSEITWDKLSSAGQSSFYKCTSLTGTLPISHMTSIGSSAFVECTGITAVELPNITTIGVSIFEGCTGLSGGLTIPSTVKTIDSGAFNGCTHIESLVLPDGITTINGGIKGAFSGCTSLSGKLVIPSTVTTIGAGAFSNCSSLDSLIIMSDVVPDSNAFSGTTNLKEVLNLSNTEWTTTSYGLDAESVQDHIEADNYLTIVSYSETVQKTGSVYDMINLIPLVITMGVVLFAVYCFIRK